MLENYEDELEKILWNSLKEKFNIKDNSKLYEYILNRYFLIYNKNNINETKQFFSYIFNELNISKFEYKDCKLKFSGDNNLNNVLCNWELNYSNKIPKNLVPDISKISLTKVKNLKNNFEYKNYLLYFKLNELNKLFKVDIRNVPKINGFTQVNKLNLEDNLKNLLKVEDNSTTFIKENDLEDYLINHLNLIEDGLIYLSRQYELDEGKIDILAKDKNGDLVIIELKIEVDKRIIWQCLYYPIEIQKIYPNKNIRMMTIMPTYPNYILEPLNKLNVEKYAYNIVVENKKIKNIILRKE